MDRTIWKRLFEHSPTEDLIRYVERSGTTIKGFRKLSNIPRPVLITHLLQPAHATKLRERLQIPPDEIKSYEDIMQELESDPDQSPIPLLLQLLSSSDPDVLDLAARVYESIELPSPETVPESTEPVKETDSSAQTKRLQKTIEKMKETHDRQRTEWNEQRKALQEELATARQKCKDQQSLETESAKLHTANQQLTQEKQTLQEKLNAKQAQINNLTQEIARLNEQIKSNQNPEVAASTEGASAGRTAAPPPLPPVTKMPLILIGELSRQNRELASTRYDIRLMDAAEFEQMLHDNQLDPAIPVWMLNYEMDMRSRMRIRRSLAADRVQEFKNYHQIRDSLI